MFDWVIGWIFSLIAALWNALLFIANILFLLILYVWNALVFVVIHVWTALQALARLFIRLWDNVLRKVVSKVVDIIDRVRDFLDRVLGPVIRVLQRIRQVLDAIFSSYIKPILDIIQRLRRVLKALRLLGFKWAEKLDQKLLRIETFISQAFLFIRGWIVFVQDLLERIVDVDGLLTSAIFINSGVRHIAGLLDALFGLFGLPGVLFGPRGLVGADAFWGPQEAAREFQRAVDGERNLVGLAGAVAREELADLAGARGQRLL